MNKLTTSSAIPTRALKLEALSNISAERWGIPHGFHTFEEMMNHDAQAICGPRNGSGNDRQAHRCGKTKGEIGFHGGNVEIELSGFRQI